MGLWMRLLIQKLAPRVVAHFGAIEVWPTFDPLVVGVVLPCLDQCTVVLKAASNQFHEPMTVGEVGICFGEKLQHGLVATPEVNGNPADRLKPRRNGRGVRSLLFTHVLIIHTRESTG